MRRRLIVLALAGIAGTALLVGLGLWQLDRLAWKEALIAEIDARRTAPPAAPPAAPDPARDRFRRVRLEGRIGPGAVHVLTALGAEGAGFRVVVPLETREGRRVLVDLGVVPEGMKAAVTLAGREVHLTGILHWPEEAGAAVPPPDRARGIWFARDLPAMARELGTEPVLVVAEAHDLGPWPRPEPPGTGLRNPHLGYALTWFALAVAWAAIAIALLRGERRRLPRG